MSAHLKIATCPWLVAALVALVFAPAPAFADESDGYDDESEYTEASEPERADDATQAAAVEVEAEAEPEIDALTGAELGSSGPRQAAHIIIKRNERAEGLHEFSLSNPVQVNGKFTQQVGVSLDYLYHLREAFAFGVGGTYNYYAAQSQFTEDLMLRAKQQPFAASTLLLDYEAHAGVEVSPIYGKFALFNWSVVQFGLYFGAYGGIGHTKVQIRAADEGDNRGRTFGDTGFRPVGIFSAGMRMFLSKHIALRIEVRDTIYSDDMSTINGCSRTDLLAGAVPADACNLGAFYEAEKDAPQAADLLKEPSSDVLHNVAFVAAFSVLF